MIEMSEHIEDKCYALTTTRPYDTNAIMDLIYDVLVHMEASACCTMGGQRRSFSACFHQLGMKHCVLIIRDNKQALQLGIVKPNCQNTVRAGGADCCSLQ